MERDYSFREAAERLKVTYQRVGQLRKQGRIAVKNGRIPESELVRYEKEREEYIQCLQR